jgi:PucR family transcriptional regulator, purine catabolism regulatory protein
MDRHPPRAAEVADGTLTVRELVEETDLGLSLVAGFASKDRLVTGVHVSEMPDPTRWLAPRTVLLSTGITLKDQPSLGAELVRRLAAADAAALGVDPHLYLGGRFPEGMIEEADRLAFPLLSIPLETPFRAITGYVHSSLLSRDFHRLRRSLSLQNHLLGQLLEDRGVAPLVSSLAMLLATTAVLFDGNGQVIAEAHGRVRLRVDRRRAWAAYSDGRLEHGDSQNLVVGDYRLDYREIRHRGRVEQVIAMIRPRSQPLPESADVILSYAEKLLTLDLLRSQDSLLLRKRMQNSLLDELLAGGGHPGELADRARHHGFDPGRPWRVVAIELTRPAAGEGSEPLSTAAKLRDSQADFLAAAEAYLSEQHVDFLSILKGATGVLLLSCSCELSETRESLSRLREILREQPPHVLVDIGISEEYKGVEMVPVAREQAREALLAADPAWQGEGVYAFSDLGPRVRVLENQSWDRLRGFYDSTVRPLADHDREHGTELVRSLETYLRLDRSVAEAAAQLFVHRNTLRNRLQKIEQLLALSLDSTDSIVDLYLGLKAQAMISGGDDRQTGGARGGPPAVARSGQTV